MVGNMKLSDLISKAEWDDTPVPTRVKLCQNHRLEGKLASKAWEELTIIEALTVSGKLKLPVWQDPLMSQDDYERARQNRENYRPSYPDMREETDESRERRRAEVAASRSRRSVPAVKKTPRWDPIQMKMTYE